MNADERMHKNIIEMNDNKLIAEFMGLYPLSRASFISYKNQEYYESLSELKYHTSWDWLMPVVNKCLNIYHIEQRNDDINFKFYDSMGDIKKTYKEVVEFIKKYNRND